MEKNIFGYVRVSSRDQKEDRQIAAMEAFGVAAEKIYIDKVSGKDFNRPRYRALVRRLKPGDVMVIKSIDRLGRNYNEIQNQWRILTREKGIDIVVLDFPLLDTRGRDEENLTGLFISDLVLQILSYVAQVERENIKQRQAEGIAVAKAKGVHFGRHPLPIPIGFEEIAGRYLRREITAVQASRMLEVSCSTFQRWLQKAREDGSLTADIGRLLDTTEVQRVE